MIDFRESKLRAYSFKTYSSRILKKSGTRTQSGLVLACVLILPTRMQAQHPTRDAHWRAEIRHQLYVPDTLPPLEPKLWSSFSPIDGVIADRVTYATASGMRVPAIVYRPAHWVGKEKHAKLPGIVIVNGHGGDKFAWYAFYSGMMFARAGAVVVTYDPIGEGERNLDRKSRAGSHDAIVQTPDGVPADDWGQRLAGLMQVDLMQAVTYLTQQPEVDQKRIATVGYSMGAFISGITGAIDPRIHAVLLSGGGTFDDEADGGKSFDTGKLPCQAPPWRSLRILGPEPHARGAIVYALNADRGPMLVENGSEDEVMDIPHRGPEWFASIRAQAIALNGTDKNIFTTHVDAGMSHRTAWVERFGVIWLNQQLHFPNWTAADIDSMPTTHISAWAHANDVDITPNYRKETREGGLNALGTGYPGIERSLLMVLPADEWTREKDQLTYEAWAEKTKMAEKTVAAERATPPK